MFQAEDEQTVVNAGQDAFAAKHGDTQLVRVPGALHSLLMETDERRDAILSRVVRFLDEQSLR
jgi:alpha-beta hydrolase superfamily lysophospholipase